MRLACVLAFGAAGAGCGYLGGAAAWHPDHSEPGLVRVASVEPLAQQEAEDCGPTALLTVLRSYGSPCTAEDLRSLLTRTPRGSVQAGALRDAARRLGYKAYLLEGELRDLTDHLRKGRPLIVGLVKPFAGGRLRHFEVVAGIHEEHGYVVTADPGRGWTRHSVEGFLSEWEPAGRLLLVVAPGGRPSP